MNLSAFIGKRYIFPNRGSGSVSLFSVISIFGIAIGIAALIVVLSVMDGITGEVRDRLLSMTAHTKVIGVDIDKNTDIKPYVADEKSVIAYAPFIVGQAGIAIQSEYKPVYLKGINPQKEVNVADAMSKLGSELATLKEGKFNIMIGDTLASQLNVGIGDKITVMVPKATISATGMLPRMKRFTVSAIFNSGHYIVDSAWALINIDDAAKLLQRGDTIDGFQIKLDDLFKAQAVAERINAKLPPNLMARDWTYEDKSYFEMIKVEKAAMFLILMIIVAVAAFNILSTLVMIVTDKRSDIAILRTLGATPSFIMRIFITQGMILGFIGTILGIALGVVVSFQVPNFMEFLDNNFGFRLPEALYFISSLHPKIEISVIVTTAILSLLLSFLTTLYPAYKAATLQPARALAND